ncbi:MAG: cytochrome P450 [Tepidiformaceae bacterium]
MTAKPGAQVDLADQRSAREPASYFREARAVDGPVQWSDAHHGWMIISYEEVEAAFREPATLSADRVGPLERIAHSQPEAFHRVVELLRGWMIFRDPPTHTRLREPVKAAFTPRRVASFETRIQTIVNEVLDGIPEGEVDLREEFAAPIPGYVIAAILGVDGSDRKNFQSWSRDLAHIVFSTSPGSIPEDAVARSTAGFTAFFSGLIDRERANPSGSILSAIANMESSSLDQMELIGACTLLLFAGHETTSTLLNTAVGTLLEQPELLAFVRGHPEAYPTFVDEILRTQGPARSMVRKVAVAHDRGGKKLEAGQTVYICIGAANHDEAVFADPARFDPLRDPNPHFGFGWGLHFCIGAPLARLEAGIALRSFVERFPLFEPVGVTAPLRGSILGCGRDAVFARLGWG